MTVFFILLAIAVPAVLMHAQSGSGTVTTGLNHNMMQAEVNRYRSCAYSYVDIKANAVYPAGTYAYDYYVYCQTRIYKSNTNAQPISDTTTIYEGQEYCPVYI